MRFREDILINYMTNAPLALAFERYVESWLYEAVPLEKPILDLGCDEGLFAHLVFDEKIDLGIDPNPRALERAKELDAYKELITCFGDNIPREDRSFRTVISNSVLEHIPAFDPVLDEVHRVLVTGGNFYFTVPSDLFERFSLISRFLRWLKLESLAKRCERFYKDFWRQGHCYPLEKWIKITQAHGFEVIDAFTFNPKRNCSINDALVPFSSFGFFVKKFTNHWILFPNIRRGFMKMLLPFAVRILKDAGRVENGGLVFIFARKK